MGAHLLDELPAVLEKYKEQIFATVTRIAQKAALTAGDYVARETPVDTGVARSNWVGTIQAPFNEVIAAYAPYPTYRPNHHTEVKQAVFRKGFSQTFQVLRGR